MAHFWKKCYIGKMEIKEIEHLAELSRVALTDDEKETMRGELDAILGYVDQIQKAPVDDVKEHKIGDYDLLNVVRDDAPNDKTGDYRVDLLADAPSTEDGYLKVKKILGGDLDA